MPTLASPQADLFFWFAGVGTSGLRGVFAPAIFEQIFSCHPDYECLVIARQGTRTSSPFSSRTKMSSLHLVRTWAGTLPVLLPKVARERRFSPRSSPFVPSRGLSGFVCCVLWWGGRDSGKGAAPEGPSPSVSPIDLQDQRPNSWLAGRRLKRSSTFFFPGVASSPRAFLLPFVRSQFS